MNKKERKKENKDLERVPFVTVRQTDHNTPPRMESRTVTKVQGTPIAS